MRRNPAALYGVLYLPKKPIMQADGQTQTAALFQAAGTGLAIKSGALDNFGVTMEVELNVDVPAAGQSFADRNGRGSKKNKNLVAQLDSSSALAQLRHTAIKGTVFENRLADGRTVGATETATKNIVDLSTLDQMLLNVIARGTEKPEHIKHYHVEHLLPYCREFIELLDGHLRQPVDRPDPARTASPTGGCTSTAGPSRSRPWPSPFTTATGTRSTHSPSPSAPPRGTSTPRPTRPRPPTSRRSRTTSRSLPVLDPAEFASASREIDWHRYRKHWIAITGFKVDEERHEKDARHQRRPGRQPCRSSKARPRTPPRPSVTWPPRSSHPPGWN